MVIGCISGSIETSLDKEMSVLAKIVANLSLLGYGGWSLFRIVTMAIQMIQ